VVLVDSSVYIRLLRDGRDPIAELATRYEATEIVGCDVVRCEVLRGVVRPRVKADLAGFFDLLVHVPMDHRVWRATEKLAWDLDRAGWVLPLADLMISACALDAGAAVLTHDRHFARIPHLTLARW
jgi:predicted nucleic acid-binding protein